MKKDEISELRALRSLGWKSNDISTILRLPVTAVEKELYLSEKKIEQSLLDENKISQLYSVDERLQQGYERCLNGLNSIIRELRVNAAKTYDLEEKKQALTSIKKCKSMIESLFEEDGSTSTIWTMVDDTLKFISDEERNL